jgi:DNA-binding response OmpR family regulator
MRLLLVEDNEQLSELLVKALRAGGYDADVVATINEARIILRTRFYVALVIDLGLPDGDAILMIRELRAEKSSLPIVILTARGGIRDRVNGLRAGADDYLVKPVATEELVARLQALLRRVTGAPDKSLKLGNLELVVEEHASQLLIDGRHLILPARDITILEVLLRRRGRVVSKTLIADNIAKGSSSISLNAIEVYVHRLRKILEDRGARVSIETVKGAGYRIHERE